MTSELRPQACSGKFNPIKQWLYFDAMEVYPEDTKDSSLEDKAPLVEDAAVDEGSRYSGQMAVLGKKMQDMLANLKIFMVRRGRGGNVESFLYLPFLDSSS